MFFGSITLMIASLLKISQGRSIQCLIEKTLIVLIPLTLLIGYNSILFSFHGIQLRLSEFFSLIIVFLGLFGLLQSKLKIDQGSFLLGTLYISIVLIGFCVLTLRPSDTWIYSSIGDWDSLVLYGQDNQVLLQFSSENTKRFIRIIVFVCELIFVKSLFKKKQSLKNTLEQTILICSAIQVLLGFSDLILSTTSLNWLFPQIRFFLLGIGNDSPIFRYGGIGICGLMAEPSHFAHSFVPGLIVLIFKKQKLVKHWILEIGIIIILILSTSFLGFGLVVFWLISILIERLKQVLSKINLIYLAIFSGGLLAFFISIKIFERGIISYYVGRVLSLIGKGQVIGSENIRLFSNTNMIKHIVKYPFWGVGLGSTVGHGFIIPFLANVGIIGFISWFLFVKNTLFFNCKLNWRLLSLLAILLVFVGDIGWAFNENGIVLLISCSIVQVITDNRLYVTRLNQSNF